MHRKFIALVCASALAVTAISAPARADEDVAKVIAGLAALAIIGAVINDHNDRDEVVVHRHVQPNYPRQTHNYGSAPRKPVVQPRPLPRNVTKYDLPKNCLKTVKQGRDSVRILGQNCMEQNYNLTKSLPNACKVQVRGNEGKRQGYKPNCLRERGYQLTGK